MTNVLILGATGSVAGFAIDEFLKNTDAQLTLYVRNARKLSRVDADRARVIQGDVLDTPSLTAAMRGQDVVYANLAGDLVAMAHSVVTAIHAARLRRLIWISSMGIYEEVPGERYRSILDPYRDSAKVIEGSDLDYTILRPGWFTNEDRTDYELTQKGQPFRGHDVSRKSLASLIVKLATPPALEIRSSLGVSNP
jgi:uncharacterized protein YbjT (DUF2867 family)